MENNVLVIEEEKQLPVMAEQHMRLIEMAVEKDFDIAKLEKLMDLQERFEANQARKSFFLALSLFQSELPEIEKTGKVGFENKDGSFTGYKHATLADIGRAIDPILSKHGLSYRFRQEPKIDPKDQTITLTCILMHRDGHSELTQMSAYADTSGKKNPIQAIASTRTYMQRYTVTDILGLTFVEHDDDGQGGGEPQETAQPNFYPQGDFDKNFQKWEEVILSGKKTADDVITVINKQNFLLTDDQLSKINGVK